MSGLLIYAADISYPGTSISQRIKLNDVGQKNGEFQVWADGVSIMNIASSIFVRVENSLIFHIAIQIVRAPFPRVREVPCSWCSN